MARRMARKMEVEQMAGSRGMWAGLGCLLMLVAVLISGASPVSIASAQDAPAAAPPASPSETPSSANEPAAAAATGEGKADSAAEKPKLAPERAVGEGSRLVRLSPTEEIWVDARQKRVVVGGTVCLREGFLEMFACPRGTKEHESVVSVNAKAFQVHTALLAIGAKVGSPVRYEPVYRAATGSIVRIEVVWHDETGKVHRRDARQMVRDGKTKKPMQLDWVFAGSGFWEDTKTGEKFYQAEGGELVCVSNFPTATLDLPVESSRDNASLLYEAAPEQIPARGTPVLLVLSVAGFHDGDAAK